MSLPHISGMWENFNEGEIIFNQVILNFFYTLYLFFFVILEATEVLSLLLAKKKRETNIIITLYAYCGRGVLAPRSICSLF
jgi:hypothetical protein